MNKLVIATLLSLAFLSGCDDTKNAPTDSAAAGNFAAKADTLSSQNDTDIRADLNSLNTIINASNTKAVEFAKSLTVAAKENNSKEIKELLGKSKELLESTNNSLLGLNIKSGEVQKIRLDIYQGNMISIKFYELYLNDNKSDAEKNEMALLQKQMIALQQSTGSKLNQLNAQYK